MKWRLPVAILSGILIVWGILPFLVARIRGVGVITPVSIGVVGLAAAVFSKQTEALVCAVRTAGPAVRVPVMVLGSIVIALLLLFIAVSVVMIASAVKTAPDAPVTVVVPGAMIRDDRPSLMLSHRLDAAIGYLEAHADAVCVVSGGQGEDETYSEAYVMQQYLLAHGVAPERIYLEDQSTNTMENMTFTREVITQNHLPEAVVIATQEFHQYRSAAYAKKAGLQPVGTATCGTPWYLFLCYWVREFAGIHRMWLLHY